MSLLRQKRTEGQLWFRFQFFIFLLRPPTGGFWCDRSYIYSIRQTPSSRTPNNRAVQGFCSRAQEWQPGGAGLKLTTFRLVNQCPTTSHTIFRTKSLFSVLFLIFVYCMNTSTGMYLCHWNGLLCTHLTWAVNIPQVFFFKCTTQVISFNSAVQYLLVVRSTSFSSAVITGV